jgi:D-alanyl-D-alanine endopeptidase (penicillin-binding protein 7)
MPSRPVILPTQRALPSSVNPLPYRTITPSTLPATSLDAQAIRNQPRLYSYSALALDVNSSTVLVSKNPNIQTPIASITKLMTAMVVLDSGDDLDEYITITPADIDTLRNTFSRLRVGMQLRRRDLLLLALMSSENRAAFALGRTAYPGGIKVFIQKMNAKARSLGMLHTQFYDPTGLTAANQSTAEDLAKMVKAAYNYDLIRQDTTTKNADVVLGTNYVHRYLNSDGLVRNGRIQIELSKTGFINEAGHCLALYTIVDGKPIIMVFLNSVGKSGRLLDAIAVKNYVERLGY